MSDGELSVILIASMALGGYLIAAFAASPDNPMWLRHVAGLLAVVQFLGVLYLMAVVSS